MKSRFIPVLIFLIFLVGFSTKLNSQYYITGSEASNIKWNQINTEHFKIVFPDYADSVAQNFANYLELSYDDISEGLNHRPKKIDVLMHMENSTSNGMVVWAPKRMETYNTPPQCTYPQDWFEQLALHEFRHVVQVDKLNIGLTKVLSVIFGQQSVGLVLGAYIPLWLLEGDAIISETMHSSTGRGRSPVFSAPLRAQLLEKGKFSYPKAKLGSYKDFVPNHYLLGYHLAAIGLSDFSKDIWADVFEYTAKKPYSIFPLSLSLKKTTGFNQSGFYHYSMEKLDSLWKNQMNKVGYSETIDILKEPNKHYTDYTSVCKLNDSSIIALKSSIDDINRIVSITNGKEKIIHTPGYSDFHTLPIHDSVIYWAEREYDLRWSHRNYNVIKKLDLRSGKVKSITKNTRYFSPEINHDGSKICAVEVTKDNKYNLVILNSENGDIIKKYNFTNYIIRPIWGENPVEILINRIIPDKGFELGFFNLKTEEFTKLIGPTFNLITEFSQYKNYILFLNSVSGINNPYVLNLDNNQIYQIASVKYNSCAACMKSDDKLLIENLTENGIKPQIVRLDTSNWIKLENVENNFVNLSESLISDSIFNLQTDSSKHKTYEVKKYSKLRHLFKFHSWGPVNIDAENQSLKPGFQLLSQNLLSSAITSVGYEYDMQENNGKIYFDFTYTGLYPELNFETNIDQRIGRINYPNDSVFTFDFLQQNNTFTISQPLNFSKGKYFRLIEPSVGFSNSKLIVENSIDDVFPRGNINSLSFKIYAHNILRQSHRDLEPRWGQAINIGYYNSPFGDYSFGNLKFIRSAFYFPGILKHHHLKLRFSYQEKNAGDYSFGNVITLSRAYDLSDKDYREVATLMLDYKFPVFYPDWNILNFLYIKRFKTNLFADITSAMGLNGAKLNSIKRYRNAGIDITADFHLFNTLLPIELGVRSIYLDNSKEFTFNLLFGVSTDF